MSDKIISHNEICRREGVSLQRGMNFGLGGNHSVILMSVRPNLPTEIASKTGEQPSFMKAMINRRQGSSLIQKRSINLALYHQAHLHRTVSSMRPLKSTSWASVRLNEFAAQKRGQANLLNAQFPYHLDARRDDSAPEDAHGGMLDKISSTPPPTAPASSPAFIIIYP